MATRSNNGSVLRKEKTASSPASGLGNKQVHSKPVSAERNKTPPDKTIPNYLKPTFSSSLDTSRLSKKTPISGENLKPSITRIRSFEKQTPASRGHRSAGSFDLKDKSGLQLRTSLRSSLSGVKTTAASSSRAVRDRSSERAKSTKSQSTSSSSSLAAKRGSGVSKKEGGDHGIAKSLSSHDMSEFLNLEHDLSKQSLFDNNDEELELLGNGGEADNSCNVSESENFEQESVHDEIASREETEPESTDEHQVVSPEDKVDKTESLEEASKNVEEASKNVEEPENHGGLDEVVSGADEAGTEGNPDDEAEHNTTPVNEDEQDAARVNEEDEHDTTPVNEDEHNMPAQDVDVAEGKQMEAEVGARVRAPDTEETSERSPDTTAVTQRPPQAVGGRKESAAYNDVIEETKNKLLEERKNKVKALVGAFETVIDYESGTK